jgi:hypothetical protein
MICSHIPRPAPPPAPPPCPPFGLVFHQGAHTAHFNTNVDFHLGIMRNERVERHQRRAKNVKSTHGGGVMADPDYKENDCYDKCGLTRQMLAQYVHLKVRVEPKMLGQSFVLLFLPLFLRLLLLIILTIFIFSPFLHTALQAAIDGIMEPVNARKPFSHATKLALTEFFETEVSTNLNPRTLKPRQLPVSRCEEIASELGEDPKRVHTYFHNLTHRAQYVPTNSRWRTLR